MLKGEPYNADEMHMNLTADESTSETGQRVLNFLIKFSHKENVIVQHLKSVQLFKLDAETIANSIIDILASFDLPLHTYNCISIYTDGFKVLMS